jgi:hypothetical protein
MIIFSISGLTVLTKSFKKVRIINFLWIVVNVSLVLWFVVNSEIFLKRNFTKMSDIIDMLNYFFAFITNLVILIHTQFVSEKDVIWHKKFQQIKSTLHDFYIKDEIIHERRFQMIKFLITFAISLLCYSINFCYAIQRKSDSTYNIMLFHAHFYALKIIINLRYIQHTQRIDAISQSLSILTRIVGETASRNTTEWKIVLVIDSYNRLNQSKKGKIDDVKDILMFKKLFSQLFEAMKLLENIFGWSLLTMISFTFVDLTSNLYWFFLSIIGLKTSMNAFDCILEIIPSLIFIHCLMSTSFETNKKSKEVINASIMLFTNTTSVYNRLVKELLMQMYHEKIENSANDFFIVDFHLSSSVSFILFHFSPSTDAISKFILES